jgi:hypothetical protein
LFYCFQFLIHVGLKKSIIMKKYLLLFATIIAIANLFAQTVVGSHGTAFGFNTTARGDFSTAIGNSTDASGTLSSALGGYIATNYKKGAFAIVRHWADTLPPIIKKELLQLGMGWHT